MLDSILVWGAVLVFAVIDAAVVRAAARGITGTAADYYLGGRRLGGMVAGLS
jgi:SSS family solute:Na+ symporter